MGALPVIRGKVEEGLVFGFPSRNRLVLVLCGHHEAY